MSNTSNSSWVYHILKKGIFITVFSKTYRKFKYLCINFPTWISKKFNLRKIKISKSISFLSTSSWYIIILIACYYGAIQLWKYFPNGSMLYLLPLMWETTWRVVVAILISVIICTPLGIYIGISPKLTRICQPIIQVLAAIPQPIFFPVIAIAILMGGGSLNFWVVPLIMAGTSWYVLFNVIAGASCIPNDLLEMSKIFNLKGIKWLFRFSIPAVFSYVVCGIISAAGGAWNSAIAAELIEWGNKYISVNGLGALISKTTENNQLPEAALACSALCVLVALCVIFIWKPLYKIAETRYKI